MAHPWLTFWLIVIGLLLLDNMVANITNAIRKR